MHYDNKLKIQDIIYKSEQTNLYLSSLENITWSSAMKYHSPFFFIEKVLNFSCQFLKLCISIYYCVLVI